MEDDILDFLEQIIENSRNECDYNFYCRMVETRDLINKQSDLINRMKMFLLKRKLMCDFLEENK